MNTIWLGWILGFAILQVLGTKISARNAENSMLYIFLPKYPVYNRRRSEIGVSRSKRRKEGEFMDYYEVLSLSEDASLEEIEERYKSINESLNSLPSVDAGLRKTVDEAYRVLSDEKLRSAYDHRREENVYPTDEYAEVELLLSDDEDDSFSEKRGFGGFLGRLFGFGNKEEISEERGRGAPKLNKSQLDKGDISCVFGADLSTLVFGGEVKVPLDRWCNCESCNGDEKTRKNFIDTCTRCNGSGMFSKSRRTPFGYISTSRTCSACGGIGMRRFRDCSTCNNSGRILKHSSQLVKVPKGTKSGSVFKLRGKGHSGGFLRSDGDLYVKMVLKDGMRNEYIKGNCIFTEVDVPYFDAILGKQITLETFNGEAVINVPSGSQHGDEILISECGGDMQHFAKINVKLPKNPSQRELELLRQISS